MKWADLSPGAFSAALAHYVNVRAWAGRPSGSELNRKIMEYAKILDDKKRR